MSSRYSLQGNNITNQLLKAKKLQLHIWMPVKRYLEASKKTSNRNYNRFTSDTRLRISLALDNCRWHLYCEEQSC